MKRRRLSLRQALGCELDLTAGPCRCRCGGKFRGARRGDPVTLATAPRWVFAALPADDPHYIPAPRRRLFEKGKHRRSDGPRRARQTLAGALHLCRHSPAAVETLEAAAVKVDVIVAAARVASESRWRSYKYVHGLFDPAALLSSAVRWLSTGGDSLAVAFLLNAKLELQRETVTVILPADKWSYSVEFDAQWFKTAKRDHLSKFDVGRPRECWKVCKHEWAGGRYLGSRFVARANTKHEAERRVWELSRARGLGGA